MDTQTYLVAAIVIVVMLFTFHSKPAPKKDDKKGGKGEKK